jgi:hypothetical protein
MTSYELYKAELEKLRKLATKRDWTFEGELAFIRQLNATKRAYWVACDGDAAS